MLVISFQKLTRQVDENRNYTQARLKEAIPSSEIEINKDFFGEGQREIIIDGQTCRP